jgi:hypothetical protein
LFPEKLLLEVADSFGIVNVDVLGDVMLVFAALVACAQVAQRVRSVFTASFPRVESTSSTAAGGGNGTGMGTFSISTSLDIRPVATQWP